MQNQETFEKIFKEHLKIETTSKSIEDLFSIRNKSRIDYKPYYQRNYVWDDNKVTYFIESILLGTEIPPLIFFDNNDKKEIIDGRQRFETIERFMFNKFSLKSKGLLILNQLKNKSYDDLGKSDKDIIEKFLDAKLRVIEFKIVNKTLSDKNLEDRVKKEIFSRYNSGITPLKKAEIDNAVYNNDSLSSKFKERLQTNDKELNKIYTTFFKTKESESTELPIEKVMNFIRKSLVLPMTPINYYARGTGRTDLMTILFEKLSADVSNIEDSTINSFFKKIDEVVKLKEYSVKNNKQYNTLALECFLWGIGILDLEGTEFNFSNDDLLEISNFITKNFEYYTEIDPAFNKQVITRYLKTSEYFQEKFKIDFSIYVKSNPQKLHDIKEISTGNHNSSKLLELENFRLNKPELVSYSIDHLTNLMRKRKFLVRPPYQRKEVINLTKASSIIESILLGITLPAIFIYKRKDGVSEVIDGQQRLLTILGFLGVEYIDEKGNSKNSKNHKFSLRKPRILKELGSKKFDDLDQSQKDKIYDFLLYIVEIEEVTNPNFEPIDLFIRLNDKPYPIKENSFEMWNSWVDKQFIDTIKNLKSSEEQWFYLKNIKSVNFIDRMENEDLITSLIFLEYSNNKSENKKRTLDIFQKTNRLNARIGDKTNITNILLELNEGLDENKKSFETAVSNVKNFIKKIRIILLDLDKEKSELNDYLKQELDSIFKVSRRTMQDFYFFWYLINEINYEMVKHYRSEIKSEIKDIFSYLKNIPESHHLDNMGLNEFNVKSDCFKSKYKAVERKIRLSDYEKLELIKIQDNKCNISGTPIFFGDDIEVDHEFPISKGGKDEYENLRIVHKDENRKKSAKI